MDTMPLLKSRTGKDFEALVEIESDGMLTIHSERKHGYLSAHRDYAQKYFGKRLNRVWHMSHINKNGVHVVFTTWCEFGNPLPIL